MYTQLDAIQCLRCLCCNIPQVYDVTDFLDDHPGGGESITISAGQDSTEEFNALHGEKARAMLEDYYIGELDTTSIKPEVSLMWQRTIFNGPLSPVYVCTLQRLLSSSNTPLMCSRRYSVLSPLFPKYRRGLAIHSGGGSERYIRTTVHVPAVKPLSCAVKIKCFQEDTSLS